MLGRHEDAEGNPQSPERGAGAPTYVTSRSLAPPQGVGSRLRFVLAAQAGAAALEVHDTENHHDDNEAECGDVHCCFSFFRSLLVRR